MPKRGSHLDKIKVKPKGPLADIVGKKPLSRGQIQKKLWKYIDKHDLKGETGDGYTATYKKKDGGKGKAIGAQIIHSGEDPVFKKFAGGKKRIAMFEMATLVEKYSDPYN